MLGCKGLIRYKAFNRFLCICFLSCPLAHQILMTAQDLRRKWTWAVEWLNDELERVSSLPHWFPSFTLYHNEIFITEVFNSILGLHFSFYILDESFTRHSFIFRENVILLRKTFRSQVLYHFSYQLFIENCSVYRLHFSNYCSCYDCNHNNYYFFITFFHPDISSCCLYNKTCYKTVNARDCCADNIEF